MLRKTLIVAILAAFLGAISVWVVGSVEMRTRRHPWKAETRPPGIEPVQFVASEGVPLKGWWWPAGESSRAIVLLHGLGANRLQMLQRAQWLHSIGYATLLFDFRGCGESGGKSSLGYDERLDVQAALRYIQEAKGVRRSALIGQGLGAAAAVMAVDEWTSVRGVVLERLFDDLETAMRARVQLKVGPAERLVTPLFLWQVRPRFGFAPEQFAPVQQIGKARCPTLLGYGGKDRTIPASSIHALFAAAPTPSTLWVLQLAGHGDLYSFDPAAYQAKIGEFLGRTLGPPVGEQQK
jgi:pimeloyl-ACP methyl ester carboxylesterase